MEGLSVKEEAFCLEYSQSGNATESYKKAGYNAKNDNVAGVEGAKLLRKPKIQARLQELAAQIATPKIATIAEIQAGLTNIFLGKEEETVVSITREGAIIKEKRPPSMAVRVKAGAELAKMLGAYTYSLNVKATVNNPFEGMTTEQLKRLVGDE